MFECGEPAYVESQFADSTVKQYYNGYIIDEASGKKKPIVLILEIKEDTLLMVYTISGR